jgi:DNA-binding response OmpR family regulator
MLNTAPGARANPSRVRARGSRILIVQEDPKWSESVAGILTTEGYRIFCAEDGREAEAMLEQAQPDLVLLGVMLPDIDGLVLCSQIRSKSRAPIIMLSATKRHRDRILSLYLGADDFITAPFDNNELIARVEAILRRTALAQPLAQDGYPPWRGGGQGGAEAAGRHGGETGLEARGGPSLRQVYKVGELTIDRARRSVTISGAPLHLTPTENRLLTTLASDPERVFSREDLAQSIWGHDILEQSRAVDVHIRRLRAKLEAFGSAAPAIITVRGFGYKLLHPSSADSA